MYIGKEDLKLLVEQIVDFNSFNQNGYSLWSYFIVQEWSSFFDMLNGPTYPHMEQSLMVQNENSKKGKSWEEMGPKKFEEVEIR